MTVTTEDPANFSASVTTAALGPLRVTRTQGGVHDSRRTRRDIERSEDRCFHLLVSLHSAWRFTHCGRTELRAGDLILNDSEYEHEINIRTTYDFLNLKLPVEWLRTWIPDPSILVGRRIPCDSAWGTVFSPAVTQLRPDLLALSPLPANVLVEHVGAMLALVAGHYEKASNADKLLLQRVTDCIRQRCGEPGLTSDQVASTLAIEPRVLHRMLATAGHTFAGQLLDARVELAVGLFRSADRRSLSLLQIARRAGFLQPLHLERAIRKRLGCTVRELQQQPLPSPAEDRTGGV